MALGYLTNRGIVTELLALSIRCEQAAAHLEREGRHDIARAYKVASLAIQHVRDGHRADPKILTRMEMEID